MNALFAILERLGRKRTLVDRGPSHPEWRLAKPWTDRYYPLFRRRPRWVPFNVPIHHIRDDDHGAGLHNHPWPYMTVILRGGYWETTAAGRFWRGPGYIGFRPADAEHRVDLEPGTGAVTLFCPGPCGLRRNPRSGYGAQTIAGIDRDGRESTRRAGYCRIRG